jgi:hypothetical protein
LVLYGPKFVSPVGLQKVSGLYVVMKTHQVPTVMSRIQPNLVSSCPKRIIKSEGIPTSHWQTSRYYYIDNNHNLDLTHEPPACLCSCLCPHLAIPGRYMAPLCNNSHPSEGKRRSQACFLHPPIAPAPPFTVEFLGIACAYTYEAKNLATATAVMRGERLGDKRRDE